MIGSLYTLLLVGASAAVTPVPAGHGSRLADYEQQWLRQETREQVQAPKPKAKPKAKAETHKPNALPEPVQQYVDKLQADYDSARTAEIRALMDLGSQARAIREEVTLAAIEHARRKQAAAAQAIEEFDVIYVAAILATA